MSERGVHYTLPGVFEGLDCQVSRAVGDVFKGVGLVLVGMLGENNSNGMLDTEGINVVGKGCSVEVVDGVDDVILGGVEMPGKHKYRQVGVEKSLLFFNIFHKLTCECGGVSTARNADGNSLGAVVNHIDRPSKVEGDDGQREAVSEIEKEGVRFDERLGEHADEHNEHAEVGCEKDSLEIDVVETVGSIVFGIDAFEAEVLPDTYYEHKQELEEEDGPEEVKVDDNDKIVAPGAGEEGARHALKTAGGPEQIHVVSPDGNREYHQGNAEQGQHEEESYGVEGSLGLCEDGEGYVNDGRGEEDDIEKEHLDKVFALQKIIEETSQEDERGAHHGEGKHHKPLGVENIAFEEQRSQGPEEGGEPHEDES